MSCGAIQIDFRRFSGKRRCLCTWRCGDRVGHFVELVEKRALLDGFSEKPSKKCETKWCIVIGRIRRG